MGWGLGQSFWEGVPQACWGGGGGAWALTIAERLWAAILELRAQPAHTGAQRKATASQKPQSRDPGQDLRDRRAPCRETQ